MTPGTGFFESEYRDGYYVDGKMKKVWAVELDLLEQLKTICERHKIKYFAIGGTLLGAVRHKGFIPWDDDIDIGMLRKDYDRFLKVCEKELEYPYFLQTPLTDNCYRAHAQIRNSDTTGYAVTDEGLDCNKGIFIDVFPLDGVTDRPLLYRAQMLQMKAWNRIFMNYFYFDAMHEKAPVHKRLFHLAVKLFFRIFDYKEVYKNYEKLCARYSDGKTKRVGEISILFDDRRYHWRKGCFRSTVMMPFENTSIAVPVAYHAFLRKTFGNYYKIPEDKNARALHGEMIFEPEVPYKK